MKILMLQDDLYKYLLYVVTNHARSGVDPDELFSLHCLHQAVKSARNVDEQELAKVAVAPNGDATVAVEPKYGEIVEGVLRVSPGVEESD